MFLRALIAFLALPGVVAFAVPLLVLRPEPVQLVPIGWPVLAFGSGMLAWCVRDFYVRGRGTLAPWAPPTRLVVEGLYRVSRNPMYLAVLCIVLAWALLFHSWSIAAYATVLALGFHARVVWGEEPWLARAHGEAWAAYAATVPRWIGRPRRRASSTGAGERRLSAGRADTYRDDGAAT